MRMLPARRGAFRLRHRHDPLFGLDALRHLRPAQCQIYRQARAHQHAAVRRVPRARYGRHPLRFREPARRDGKRAQARSAGGTARQLSQRPDVYRQRSDGEQLRAAPVRRLGRAGERLEGAQAQTASRKRQHPQRPGLCLLALHQRRLEAREPDRRAARDGQDQARFRRIHRRAVGRRGYRASAQDKGLTFSEVVTEALKDSGTITVTGNYSTIPQSHGGKKYRGAAIGGTMGYSYSAQVVEVSVDEETGVVDVDKVWVAHDCGRALNRLTVEGQVQGSVWMGMGQAMSEETAYHDGLLVTANMLDYRVPTIQDSPPIEVGIIESNDPHGPFGAKEAGEGSLAAFLPALTNAIADAIGVRFNTLPVTPDRVFAALEKRRRAGTADAAKSNTGDA